MSIENLLEITARLSDVQELLTRGRTTEAAELIEDTKKELFFREPFQNPEMRSQERQKIPVEYSITSNKTTNEQATK